MPHKTDMQVALISGGTSGIGMATAELLLKQGWCVVINGRHEKDGQRAALKLRRFSSKVRFVAGDVSKVDDCKRIVKQTVDMFGDISALVTAAGYYEEELLVDVTEQSFDEMFGTNEDGSQNSDYCCYCYKDGKFLQDCTMDEMIAHCVNYLAEFNGACGTKFTEEEAIQQMQQYFPRLKRWKKN